MTERLEHPRSVPFTRREPNGRACRRAGRADVIVFGGGWSARVDPKATLAEIDMFRLQTRFLSLSAALLSTATSATLAQAPRTGDTRSIVACDTVEQSCGIASATYLPVGAIVPLGDRGLVVANQAVPNYEVGRRIVDALTDGGVRSVAQAVDESVGLSPMAGVHQLAVAMLDEASDSGVQVATYTGPGVAQSLQAACAVEEDTFAVVADTQTTDGVCAAMASGFRQSIGRLAIRLLDALILDGQAGGDVRGERSGVVVVYSDPATQPLPISNVSAHASVNHSTDWARDLRWELTSYLAFNASPVDADMLRLDMDTASRLQQILTDRGFYDGVVDGVWTAYSAEALSNLLAAMMLPWRTQPTVQDSDGEYLIDSVLRDFVLMANERGALIDQVGLQELRRMVCEAGGLMSTSPVCSGQSEN